MKRIGQKQLSLLLCLVLLFTMAIPAGARASDYFNNTYLCNKPEQNEHFRSWI